MVQPLIDITRRHALWFAFFLLLYECLTYVANDMIMPGMLQVVHSFRADDSAVATSLTAYILGGASLQLILGPLSDRYGRRPVMLAGVVLFFICTILLAASQSMPQFILMRFFQGMGLCFIAVIGYTTLQEIFAETDAVKLIAIMASISILAPLLGPLLGSIFIHFFNWRLIFISIATVTFLPLWGLWHYMPESLGQRKKDGTEIKPVSLAPSVIFGNYSQLLRSRTFCFASLAAGVLTVPCLCWIALSPLILMREAHLSVIEYALWQIPVFGASIIGNIVLHYSIGKMSLLRVFHIGSLLSTASLLLVALLPLARGGAFIWLMPGLIAYFFGLGMTTGPLVRLILFATDVSKGTASAMMSMIMMCILALGIELGNHVYAHNSNLALAQFFMASAVLYLLLATWGLHRMKTTKA
ncbi:MAG: MFS transporter [Legionellaceae bacterium]|nr:MFS transporter [Legionellaceae bacterium]